MRDSSGAVLILVALLLPVFILAGGLVVDVGNWLAHKRHLQVQADAGALAAAGKFRACPNNEPLLQEARTYSSVGAAPGYNPQTGGTPQSRLHSEINSKTFFGQTSPVDTTVVEDDPCPAAMIDVKLTETDLPWLLRVAQVKYINAQARVELRRQTIGKNLIPLGVPNVEPKKARAFFVDQSKATTDPSYVIASTPLVRNGTRGTLALWSNPTTGLPPAPVTVPLNVDVSKIGLRVALGESATALTGSYTAVCALVLVTCYDQGAANGLVNIRGWSNTASSATQPAVARGVSLFGATCADGYFNVLTATCTIGARATVDFFGFPYGPGAAKPAGAKLQAQRSGSATKYDMAYDTATGTWSTSAIPIAADNDGPVSIDLVWSTGCNAGGNNCTKTGTIAGVQRSFEGSDLVSGPIQSATISDAAGVPSANSFQIGSVPNLDVTIGVSGSIAVAASVSDPAVTLKFNQGGLTGFLDCDPALPKVSDEIAVGCAPPYTVNTGNACPFAGTPQQCVPVEPGNKVGLLAPGLNLRILGAEKPGNTCTSPNNWSQFGNGLPEGDPRIIQLFITPLGAFDGNGNGTEPILDFAAFYVTGWQGVGAGKNPCQAPGQGDDPANVGEIRGHFIKYIDLANPEGADEEFCDFTSLSPCVTLFTR